MKNIIIAVLCIATCIITWSNSIVAQTEQSRHELQIGYYLGQGTGPGLGFQYYFSINSYFSLSGGVLAYNDHYNTTSIMEDFKHFVPEHTRYFIQAPNFLPVNNQSLGKDDYKLHWRTSSLTYSYFAVHPEIGINFQTPKFLYDVLQLSVNYSMRLDMHSFTFSTEIGPMFWEEEEVIYVVNYYERQLGPIGFNLHPVLKCYLSDRTYWGIHFYMHGDQERLAYILRAMGNAFHSFYGTYGVVLGTKF